MSNLLRKSQTDYSKRVTLPTYHEIMVELTRPDTSDPENPGLVESRIESISLVNNGQLLGPRIRQLVDWSPAFDGWTLHSWWTPEPTDEF